MTVVHPGLEEETSSPPPLTSRVAVGVRWGIFDQIVQQGTTFVVTVVLTRLLGPHTLGVMAICWLVVSLGDLVSGIGLSPALVHRQVVTRRQVNSALTASLIMGVVLAGIMALSAPLVAHFFHTPQATGPLVAMSVIFLFRGAAGVPLDMLRRELHFREYVLSSTAGGVASAAVGLALGIYLVHHYGHDAGIWALVAYGIADAFAVTTFAWYFAIRRKVWRPRLGLHMKSIRELAGFSSYLVGAQGLAYVQLNGDNFSIGRALGPGPLAFYGLAYRLMVLPVQKVSYVLGNVAFPAFARVQDDVRRLRKGFLRGVRTVAVVCFPITIGIVVTAHVLVPVVFGSKWMPAVAALQILALNGPRIAIISLNSQLWQAIGKPKWSLWTSVIAMPLYLIAFVIGAWGFRSIEAVAWGLTIAGALSFFPTIHLAGKAIKRSPWVIVNEVKPVAVATVLMATVAIGVGLLLPNSVGELTELLCMAASGAITYLLAVRLLVPDILPELLSSLTGRTRR